MSAAIEIKSTVKCFGGNLIRFVSQSTSTKTPMTCAVYIPQTAIASSTKVPTLFYLSGLTCTDENVCQKSGIFKALSETQMALVAPDTSPRGAGITGESDSWDFGVGAGFYLDATNSPWSENYNMYSYITKELPSILAANFPSLDGSRFGVTGHSMGGHGALTIAIKNPDLFKSVSAFAPICNPVNCPWGQKAFTNYLGSDTESWKSYDATELIKARESATGFDNILVDVGTDDSFLKGGQLRPEEFEAVCAAVGQPLTLRLQDGYDHGYYFVSSFIEDHVKFHSARL